jgi:DNA-binding CsgD family transcriptional regulator
MPRRSFPGVLVSTTGNEWSRATFQSQEFAPNFLTTLPNDQVHIVRELYTQSALDRESYYSRYLKRFGIEDIICLNLLHRESGMIFRLRATRDRGEPFFSNAERRILEALIPRFNIAVAIYAKLALQQFEITVNDELASKLEIGSITLDQDGGILKLNSAAERLLKARDGFDYRANNLCAVNRESDGALQAAITEITERLPSSEPPADVMVTVRRDQNSYWNVLCRPVLGKVTLDSRKAPAVLVLVRKGGQNVDISDVSLSRLFHFTKAEAKLATKLINGLSLSEAAKELGVSPLTARCQLGAMFSKTDCHRQPQLVSLILNTVNSVWPVMPVTKRSPVASLQRAAND